MTGPPMVATLYGILLFKEIKGKRNLIILGVGFLFTIVGSVLCGLSK
jgi:glucose uptake protein GlcU